MRRGSFLIRSSVLFWNCWISWRATVPGQYFLVFLTSLAWRNSFWRVLLPMVGWSFLLTGSFPKVDGLASAAIWAKLSGWQWQWWPTHILQPSSLLYPPLSLFPTSSPPSLVGEGFLAGEGWWTGVGGLLPFLAILSLSSFVWSTLLSPLSFLGVSFVLAILLKKIKKETVASWKHFYRSQETKIENLHQIKKIAS